MILKVFIPSETQKQKMFADMQESLQRKAKKAQKSVIYEPKNKNIYYLFTTEWQNNKPLNRMFGSYHNVNPNYFIDEKGGTLYYLMNLYLCDNAIQQAIYDCNMPPDTWHFCKWFYNTVSHSFLKEHFNKIPDFEKEESMFEFVVNHKLIEKTYSLFMFLNSQNERKKRLK